MRILLDEGETKVVALLPKIDPTDEASSIDKLNIEVVCKHDVKKIAMRAEEEEKNANQAANNESAA
jgi:hypothetical protein